MDEKTALHTAARRFCEEQHSLWASEYMALEHKGDSRIKSTFSMNWEYSDEAHRLFPRYRLDNAMLIELERLVPADLGSLEATRIALLEAGERAYSQLVSEFKKKKIALAALRMEFDAFRTFIKKQAKSQLDAISSLPHRRVLTLNESQSIWSMLRDRWIVQGRGHYWYPIGIGDPPGNAIAFHQELWNARDGHALLLRFLQQYQIHRCFLLLEIESADYEIDVSLIKSYYTGEESFLTNNGEWLLYLSHESSLTLAGSLADFFRHEWRDSEQITYGGPFHTDDLRGTWKS